MARTFVEFADTIDDEAGGGTYVARVAGAARGDGTWVGWIEFVPLGSGPMIVTGRETTQPDRANLAHWASGLSYAYLQGALHRAKRRAAEATESSARIEGSPLRPRTAGLSRLEIVSGDPTVPERVLEWVSPQVGAAREVPGGGTVVYEGTINGGLPTHVFALQYHSPTSGAILSNWLWSRLHGLDSLVMVDDTPVQITNDGIRRALVGV